MLCCFDSFIRSIYMLVCTGNGVGFWEFICCWKDFCFDRVMDFGKMGTNDNYVVVDLGFV